MSNNPSTMPQKMPGGRIARKVKAAGISAATLGPALVVFVHWLVSLTGADLPMPVDSDDVPLRLAVRNGERWDMILSTAIDQPAQKKLLLLPILHNLYLLNITSYIFIRI